MTSVRSPPSPRLPVSSARSRVVGCSISIARSPAVARLQASSQSAWARSEPARPPVSECGIRSYPRVVSDPLHGLTDAQREAAVHADGPLLLLGGAGTGKTRALIARFGWLVEQGVAPERIALLASSAGTAAALRTRVEGVIERAYEELAVASVPELCARLLRGESPAAGLDPFAAAASGADRLALLLERI